jgi:phosphoribosylformimino-5-aminoimidazole carboxamide ribotide isomerase
MSRRRPLRVIPAIDLRGGRCVRLLQGAYDRETVYSDDPVAVARRWVEAGADRLHVVDLDGARSGDQLNAGAVRAILEAVGVPVQLGGGVRDIEAVGRWLAAGIDRVFLGTAAVETPALLVQACRAFPGRVGAGADARGGRVAVRGWQQGNGEPVLDFIRRVLDAGVAAVSYTDISRDGTLAGVDVESVRGLVEALPPFDADFIVAGGVASLDDIRRLAAIDRVDAVISGRALYEGRLDLRQAIAAANA